MSGVPRIREWECRASFSASPRTAYSGIGSGQECFERGCLRLVGHPRIVRTELSARSRPTSPPDRGRRSAGGTGPNGGSVSPKTPGKTKASRIREDSRSGPGRRTGRCPGGGAARHASLCDRLPASAGPAAEERNPNLPESHRTMPRPLRNRSETRETPRPGAERLPKISHDATSRKRDRRSTFAVLRDEPRSQLRHSDCGPCTNVGQRIADHRRIGRPQKSPLPASGSSVW